MELNEAVAGRIKGYLKEREITQFNLFGSSGTACSTISMICRQKVKDVKLSTILNLCRGLNIELKEFFDDDFNDISRRWEQLLSIAGLK